MGKKESLIKKLKRFKNKISKKYGAEKIIFFGSRASGKPHEDSDVDLIIVSKKFEGVSSFKRSPDLYLEWHLKTDIGLPVDFLCYTPEEFDRLKNQVTIVREAVETGIEI
ncbi:MAG: nucleotidyltransferase domain-containing protein [archaeon]